MSCWFDSEYDSGYDRTKCSTMKWDAEIARTGKADLLCFGTADMDFRSPQPILDAIHSVAEAGHLGYPKIRPSYYDSIVNWIKRRTDWDISPEWISTNVGVYPACWTVIDSLTQPGDEIIIQTPVHFVFDALARDSERVPVYNPLVMLNGKYTMDFEQLEKSITNKTKLLWLCNPHNPVGRAWSKQELTKLAEICLKHNIKVLSDDVYCGLVHEGHEYTSIASISKESSMNTITCYSASKIYNTTGDKSSFVVCENTEILEAYNKSLKKLNLNFGQNIIGLAVTEAAFNCCDEWVSELMKYVWNNYKYMSEALERELPAAQSLPPEATYFAWIDISKLGIPPENVAEFFENNAGICVEPGIKFGAGGSGYIRFNLACQRTVLEEGVQRMINSIKNRGGTV